LSSKHLFSLKIPGGVGNRPEEIARGGLLTLSKQSRAISSGHSSNNYQPAHTLAAGDPKSFGESREPFSKKQD